MATELTLEWVREHGFEQQDNDAWAFHGPDGFAIQLIEDPARDKAWIVELGNRVEDGPWTWCSFPRSITTVEELDAVLLLMDPIPW